MTKQQKYSEKIYFSLIVTDYDYISTRHLLAGSLFSSAASMANLAIDRYIKTYFWSIKRDDLVDKIKSWGGNKSHNVIKMLELYNQEFDDKLELNTEEKEKLNNIFICYKYRYIDNMYKEKKLCKIYKNYMYIIDKVCMFFRNKIELKTPFKNKTIIDILLNNNPKEIGALNTGNINLRELLIMDNKYLS